MLSHFSSSRNTREITNYKLQANTTLLRPTHPAYRSVSTKRKSIHPSHNDNLSIYLSTYHILHAVAVVTFLLPFFYFSNSNSNSVSVSVSVSVLFYFFYCLFYSAPANDPSDL